MVPLKLSSFPSSSPNWRTSFRIQLSRAVLRASAAAGFFFSAIVPVAVMSDSNSTSGDIAFIGIRAKYGSYFTSR